MKTIIEVNAKVEMPKECCCCPFSIFIEATDYGESLGWGTYYCSIGKDADGNNELYDTRDDDYTDKPDWCPIISISEVEDET